MAHICNRCKIDLAIVKGKYKARNGGLYCLECVDEACVFKVRKIYYEPKQIYVTWEVYFDDGRKIMVPSYRSENPMVDLDQCIAAYSKNNGLPEISVILYDKESDAYGFLVG